MFSCFFASDRVRRYINEPRSIYQCYNKAPRLSGQIAVFGVVFFVSKSLERQKKLKKITIFTPKPVRHVTILIYRTWPIF